MTKMEKEVLAERISAMSDEEKMFVLRFIPNDYLSRELERRYNGAAMMLNSIDDIINNLNKESTLEDMRVALMKIKEVLY